MTINIDLNMKRNITKSSILLVICTLLMCTFTSCETNEQKKDRAISKIEKALKNYEFEKALSALDRIPAEFEVDKETYYKKIKSTLIKYQFANLWTKGEKEDAFRNQIEEMYPYVGIDYLLSELLKLEQFGSGNFREIVDDWFQSDYDSYIQKFNNDAEGWNKALLNIAIIAAKNGDYATANRCISEFKQIAKMVSRTYSRTTKYNDKQYVFKTKLIDSPSKGAAIKRIQSVKMVSDIENEFNAANFARGSSQLSDNAKYVLNKLVKLLAQDSALSVKFIGHTSADGEDTYNLQLSKDRAKAAANYIESKGINYIRIGFEGKGSSELKNKYDPTSEENCRIEIILL